jgi:hypothetical protein
MDRYPDEKAFCQISGGPSPKTNRFSLCLPLFGNNTRNEVSRRENPEGFHKALMDTKPVIEAKSFDDDQVVPAKTVRDYGRFSQLAYVEVDMRVCLICHQSSLFC